MTRVHQANRCTVMQADTGDFMVMLWQFSSLFSALRKATHATFSCLGFCQVLFPALKTVCSEPAVEVTPLRPGFVRPAMLRVQELEIEEHKINSFRIPTCTYIPSDSRRLSSASKHLKKETPAAAFPGLACGDGHPWVCEHRRPEIANMVAWRLAA